MRIVDIIWRPEVIDKLAWKHGATPEEVDQVLFGRPLFRKVQKGMFPTNTFTPRSAVVSQAVI